jgi:hypothetical protein
LPEPCTPAGRVVVTDIDMLTVSTTGFQGIDFGQAAGLQLLNGITDSLRVALVNSDSLGT